MSDINSVNQQKQKKINSNAVLWIISLVLTIVIVLGAGILKEEEKHENEQEILEIPDFTEIVKIGDLMTLKCYYHNVAEYEKEPDGLFQYGLLQVGKKKFWVEYTGTVKIGIDINKVEIGTPDENGIVRVYVPEVDKFEANQDSSSIQEPVYEKSWFTSITTEEKTAALAAAQEKMLEAAKTDQSMIRRARENAKSIIEQYIINTGMALGQEYRVQWVDTPEAVNIIEEEGTEDGKEEQK